jgi:hypothetical protein
MRFHIPAAIAAAAALIASPAYAWGKTGHRVVAAIAATQLSGLAHAQVEQILGYGESLDEAANWPDEMRAAPGQFWQKTATPWHYVTLNGVVYDHAPPEGDALDALDERQPSRQAACPALHRSPRRRPPPTAPRRQVLRQGRQ